MRKLLWERVLSGQIAALVAGRGAAEIERMFLGGIEMVARSGEGGEPGATALTAETWRRVGVAPGVELHLRADLPKPRPAELEGLVERLGRALRRNL